MGRGYGGKPYAGLLCALMLAIAMTVLPATAAARQSSKQPRPPPKEFFGVQAIAPPTLGQLGALRAGRIGTLRETFFWPAVERTPGARRWLGVDYAVGQAANHGIRVLPILYGTPPHLSASFSDPPIHSAAARAAWALFVGDAVRRYGPGGSFWQQYSGVPYLPVTHWQVWNEPNGSVYWNGQPSPWAYADLVKLTSGAIRQADPSAKVMLAGLLKKPREQLGISMRRFLGRIYRARGMKRFFDAVAVHPYAVRPRRALRAAEAAREVMVRNGDRETPIWITELGWATGGTGDFALVTTPEGQARKLAITYRKLLRERRGLRLKGIIWLMLRDHAPLGHSTASWIYHMGLFTAQGAAKPSWPALTTLTGGQPAAILEPPPQATSPPPPPPPPPGEPPDPCFLIIFC